MEEFLKTTCKIKNQLVVFSEKILAKTLVQTILNKLLLSFDTLTYNSTSIDKFLSFEKILFRLITKQTDYN